MAAGEVGGVALVIGARPTTASRRLRGTRGRPWGIQADLTLGDPVLGGRAEELESGGGRRSSTFPSSAWTPGSAGRALVSVCGSTGAGVAVRVASRWPRRSSSP